MVSRLFAQVLVAATLLLGVFAPLPVFAGTNPLGGVNCSGQASNSALCATGNNTEDPLTGPNGTLIKVANLLAVIAGFAAVIFLVIGGIKYITAGGASDQVAKAKETIIYALVGIVLIAFSRAIIGFVLSRV